MTFTESIIEQVAIDWLQELGYAYLFDPEVAFDGAFRIMVASFRDMLLPSLMRGEVRVRG